MEQRIMRDNTLLAVEKDISTELPVKIGV